MIRHLRKFHPELSKEFEKYRNLKDLPESITVKFSLPRDVNQFGEVVSSILSSDVSSSNGGGNANRNSKGMEEGDDDEYDDNDEENEYDIDDSSNDDSDEESSDDDDNAGIQTRSGRTVKQTRRFIEECGNVFTEAEKNYYSVLEIANDFDDSDAASELAAVGAGLGGGFETTQELHVMKYNEAMKTDDKKQWEEATYITVLFPKLQSRPVNLHPLF